MHKRWDVVVDKPTHEGEKKRVAEFGVFTALLNSGMIISCSNYETKAPKGRSPYSLVVGRDESSSDSSWTTSSWSATSTWSVCRRKSRREEERGRSGKEQEEGQTRRGWSSTGGKCSSQPYPRSSISRRNIRYTRLLSRQKNPRGR